MRSRTATPMRTLAAIVGTGALIFGLGACSSDTGTGTAKSPALSIIAPADPGGGWDQTARALSEVLSSEKLASAATVTNIGGAGGTVGLAKLATEKDPNTLMVTGLVMVGAVETNGSATRIEDTTPIAKLSEEALVIVVPKDSPYQSLGDLVDDIVAKGAAVSVTGGSAGGADHILAGMLLTEAGVAPGDVPSTLNYIANSGGGEAVTMLLGGKVAAGISGVGEFAEHVTSGSLRALAVSSPEKVAELPDTPTITETGYDVTLTNWRGLLAPGSITEAEAAALTDTVTKLHDSAAWTAILADRGWSDAFLTGTEFDTFLTANIAEVTGTLKDIGLVQ